MAYMKRVLAMAALVTLSGAVVVPTVEAGFCCKTTRAIRLVPDPAAPVRLSGRAEIDQCYGMSFLRVTVEGNLPDGSSLTPAFPSIEPFLGDPIVMTRRHGDGVTGPNGIFENPTGRTLVIYDDSFTPLLSGTF